MRRVIELGRNDWPGRRAFAHPGLETRDCKILIGLIRDLDRSRNQPPQVDTPRPGRDRVIVTASGREHEGAVAIVGFFGERSPAGTDDVEAAVEKINAEMVAEFDEFPVLLGYVSRLLDDGFNFANLVVLAGADGMSRWRDLPRHVRAASDLAPRFYSSVRIYNGSLPAGMAEPERVRLDVVKYWDYSGDRVWHAVRSLGVAN